VARTASDRLRVCSATMRRGLALLAAFAIGVAPMPRGEAGEPTATAADATESGRRLDRALDIVIDGTARQGEEPRTLLLLIDPSA